MFRSLLATLAQRRHGVAVVAALTLAIVAVSGVVAFNNAREQDALAGEVIRIHRVIATLNQLETTLIDAETGQRGFLLTGDEQFLAPYLAATGAGRLNALRRRPVDALLADAHADSTPGQRVLLADIDALVRAKLDELALTIALSRSGQGPDAVAIVRAGRGKNLMDALRVRLARLRAQEGLLLREGERRREAASRRALASAGVLGAASVVALALLLAVTRLAARRQARSEQRFRSLVEASAAVVWSVDAGGAMGDNPGWRTFSGQSAWRQRGHGYLAAVHREDRAGLRLAWDAGCASGRSWDVHCRVRSAAQGWRDMLVRAVSLREQGTVREWVGTCTDITELLLAEGRLRRFAESDLIGIMLTDDLGRVEYANDEYLRIVGRARPAVLGQPHGLPLPGGDLPRTRVEFDHRRADGGTLTLLAGVAQAGPAPQRLIVFLLDVSEQQRMARALREQQAEFRMLADNISQHAWTAGADGRLLWCNLRWQQYTGLEGEAGALGQWPGPAVHPEHVARVRAGFTQAVATGAAWEDTFPLRAADGHYQWFLARALPIRDAGGRVLRWFGTHTDIDERLRLEQQLQQASRRKDEFIAVLAHELRNPLAPILSGLELLRLHNGLPPPLQRTRAIMERQLAHLVHLIDDLLDVARITSGKLALRRRAVTVQEVVDSALDTSRPHIAAAHHRLTVSLPDQPLWLDGDPVRLAQALANLLNNAAKYTPEGGAIAVQAQADGAQVDITVQDNGIGIAPALLPHLFELFSQAQDAQARRKGGMGLGLAIARQLVQLHGGSLTAASAGPGQGSRFTVRLPLAAAPAPATLAPAAAPDLPAKRILLLDDNEDAAQSLGSLLSLGGHAVTLAHTGAAAIAAARAEHPEVALLDLGLPDMSGLDVARALRADPALAGLRLVALTGWGGAADRQASRAAGFDAHLTKPVNLEALQAAVPGLQLP